MTQLPADPVRPSRFKKTRAAALGFGLGATLALSPLVWAQNPPADTTTTPSPGVAIPQQSFAPLVKRVLPAVVNISVTGKSDAEQTSGQSPEEFGGAPFDDFLRRFFDQHGGQDQQMPRRFGSRPFGGAPFGDNRGDGDGGAKHIALGSGFIIDASGTIVTNNHVVGEAAKVEVTLQDNSKYTARIVGRDQRTDIAVLKIKADKPLPYVSFGDSNAAQIGDWVVAVGNPFGLGGSVTTGIISARGRDIHAGQFDDFLQIDAPINRGNSGGPTFDLKGEVIGINTAIYSPNGGSVGIGFAVPSNVAKSVVAQLKEGGHVTRGWLGVAIQSITPALAKSLGMNPDEPTGALVATVTANSPAAKAGLKPGDVILTANGQPVKSVHDLPRLVASMPPGQKLELSVRRGGKDMNLAATTAEMPQEQQTASAQSTGEEKGPAPSATGLGLQLAAIDQSLRREFRIPKDVEGAVVTKVASDSPAAAFGIEPGV